MSLLIFIILGFYIVFSETFRRRVVFFDAMFFASAFFFWLYCLIPILLIINPEWRSETRYLGSIDLDLDTGHIAIICLIAYLMLKLGWAVGSQIRVNQFLTSISKRDQLVIILLGFVIGLVSLFLYFKSYGGFFNALVLGSAVRYGRIDLDFGQTGVFKHFIGIFAIIALVFWAKYLQGIKLSHFERFIFIASVAFTLFSLLVASGRASLLIFIFSFFIISTYYFTFRRYPLSHILRKRIFYFGVISAPLGLIFISFGKQLFWALPALFIENDLDLFISEFKHLNELRIGSEINLLRDVVFKEGSHALVSIQASLDSNIGFLFFRDFFLMPIHLIPNALIGTDIFAPKTVTVINTLYVHDQEIASYLPGLIAMLIYNSGVFGVPFGMFIYGLIGSFMQKKFSLTPISGFRNVMLFYFSFIYGGFLMNGDIKILIYGNFSLIIVLVGIFTHSFISKSLR